MLRFRLGRAIRSIVGLALAAVILWLIGLIWFVRDLDRNHPDGPRQTDAIVVLTGGSQRIDHGLALLLDGDAKKLFISGVNQSVAEAEMQRLTHIEKSWIDCCIVLGHAADNTVGNARETAAWLASENYHSLRLVTANYHMRRALLEFKRALAADVAIVPDSVAPDAARRGIIGPWRGTSPVIITEYTKYLGALIRFILSPLVLSATTVIQ